MDSNSAETARLIGQAQAGNAAALNELFARHHDRLRRMARDAPGPPPPGAGHAAALPGPRVARGGTPTRYSGS